jgi:hypothetical protein
METTDLPCSRNARSRTPLVGRAQWKINQPPSLERERAGLEEAYIFLPGPTQSETNLFARHDITESPLLVRLTGF